MDPKGVEAVAEEINAFMRNAEILHVQVGRRNSKDNCGSEQPYVSAFFMAVWS